MTSRVSPLKPLQGEQLRASAPDDLVWLSASAGTGKTHVLTARVLRLLLAGVKPESILCLTFTKAGAAEMADRIQARLAHWVRLDARRLSDELAALGEAHDASAVRAARTLFAQVLDAPCGGLRIQTIHAFCQTLLAGFPAEAGLTPGFRPLEGREEAALARQVLAELLVNAEARGDLGVLDDLSLLSLRLGEARAEGYLRQCARACEAMAGLGVREGIEPLIRTALGVPLGDVEQKISDGCEAIDPAELEEIAERNRAWGSARGAKRIETIRQWLEADAPGRVEMLETLHLVWAKTDGELNLSKGWVPPGEDYAALVSSLHERCAALLSLRARAAFAALVAAGLRVGQAYALEYAGAKRSAGRVDFDDLIRLAVRLLATDGIGDWVRYKLDQAIDHILVDEAQDTNGNQWAIVASLAAEYFTGEGAKAGVSRTVFTVGDFKQAIFGFQGTNPAAFDLARRAFAARAEDVGRRFIDLSLDRSFRSAPPVLELVDALIETVGAGEMGVPDRVERHASARGGVPGQVTLWKPVASGASDTDAGGVEDDDEERWIDDAVRTLAGRIARQIRQWLDDKLWVVGRGRPLRPEDILILVRKRGDLAALIVARLHAEGVPVAGVDRLRLNAPLAVRDLLSAIRFVLQPDDDLNLAGLLVSPLIGWSQKRLYHVGFGRPGSLWRAVRDHPEGAFAARLLGALLAQADFVTPHAFMESILSGPLRGRERLLARLGEEARDPIEELLNAALAFEGQAVPTFQRFLDWFDRGEVEITRDPAAPADAVRVMTVHGSKGLQAPLVILADATGDPETARQETVEWSPGDGDPVPIVRPRKAERCDAIEAAASEARDRDRQEHWRLAYVALTRAEERLVIGGALGRRAKDGEPPEHSWYRAIDAAMDALGADREPDPLWGEVRHYRGTVPARTELEARRRITPPSLAEPAWLRRKAPAEARPPRPLAPSAIGLDKVSDPPPGPAMAAAAQRGKLLHALFERLPPLAPSHRRQAGLNWLERAAGAADPGLVEQVCAILEDPAHAHLFVAEALAEAPIAAVVGERVISGTVDRLIVTDTHVIVLDYKTGRRVPESPSRIPGHHLDQMAAYVAALSVIFPGHAVEAALLYTSGPRLFRLDQEILGRCQIDGAGVEPEMGKA